MKKGEIYYGSKRDRYSAYHPIVFLEGKANGSFIGGVLTHSKRSKNVLMKNEHFEAKDNNGKEYKLSFDNTYLVIGRFVKPREWGPYTKVGQLSKKGIDFIEELIGKLMAEHWDDYIQEFI